MMVRLAHTKSSRGVPDLPNTMIVVVATSSDVHTWAIENTFNCRVPSKVYRIQLDEDRDFPASNQRPHSVY
jgi:hypothetical protein